MAHPLEAPVEAGPNDLLEERVSTLEVRLSFLERTLEDLDGVVRSVADEMVRVREALKDLEGRVGGGEGPANAQEAMLYEKPPHY